jgi:hypothetical protein
MRVICFGLAVLAVACTSSDVKQTGRKYDARPANWPIAVYASSEAPASVARLSNVQAGKPPGIPIGNIRVKESMVNRDYDFSFHTARQLARQLGGDSLYITGGSQFSADARGRHDLRMTVYRHND